MRRYDSAWNGKPVLFQSVTDRQLNYDAIQQETLYVLQNNDLMKQIAASAATHVDNKGYQLTAGELSEITGI